MKVSEIYTLECFVNTFIYCSYVVEEDRWCTFIINPEFDQSRELFDHLTRSNFYQIGFNNSKYHYLLLHHFLNNYSRYNYESPFFISNDLYIKSQQLLNSEEQEFIRNKDVKIIQIDLMSLFHLNYKSKRTSLKDMQFALNVKDINECPVSNDLCINNDDFDDIIKYCQNNITSIYKFYLLSRGKTDNPVYKNIDELSLRGGIRRKFGLKCYNWPNVKVGEQLLLSLYCKTTGKKWDEVKASQTDRSHVYLIDCIPSYCKFESKEFNNLLDLIKTKTIDTSIMDFETEVIYHGIKLSVGCGGLHGSIKPGVYKSDDNNVILSLDVESLYPRIAQVLKLYPEHLGITFNDIYCPFIDERIVEKHKEDGDKALIKAYKLILNSAFGKSNEHKSFLLDQLYFLRTTFGGQLFTCMWIERIVKACNDVKFLLVNTDGLEFICPKTAEKDVLKATYDLVNEIGFTIEQNYYKQMIIKDVNNYIGEYIDSTIEKEHLKLKGCFEIYKEIHKDHSMRIVPIALKNYFIYNIPVSNTIKNSENIFDFCIRLKINKHSRAIYTFIENNSFKNIELGRTTRYFCSNAGGSLSVFYNNSEKPNRLNKDYSFTLFNNYYDSEDYNINYQYYITEANKIKDVIEDMQLLLF